MSKKLDIAIIGVAGIYPGAGNARQYWQNILDKVDAVTDGTPEWAGPTFEENATDDDRIYTTRGGFLGEHARVNPQLYGVMPSVAAGADPDHLLVLKCAHDALEDAGYLHKDFDRQRAGVIIGRGTYGNRGMLGTMSRTAFLDQAMELIRGVRPDFTDADIRALKTALKAQLPPFQGEHIGVLTPNVIAGLVANRLNLMGPSFIVDAACATTMIALEAAVRELRSERCDLMLIGGSQVHTPPQIFMQFCRINALSRDRIRPFQKGADGTLLGEGVGVLVLKRRADAERDGDRIYAVIQGLGVASDGRAKGLLTPRLEGEILSIRRAYESSGIDPDTVDLIEAHGTGTSVGDKTEIEALNAVYGGRGPGPQVAITAVKSMIGHCMPASGGASLIKTALALHQKVLPPMLCEEPDPALGLEQTPFYINTETRPWTHGKAHPRRAGANAFGFGGINTHVILEEHVESRATQVQVLHAPSDSELLTLGADSRLQLLERITAARAQLAAGATLAEVAKACSVHARGEHRLAVVASNSADLDKKLAQAQDKLGAADAKPFKTRGGLHYGRGAAPGKLCFLFPGEGSQYPNMLADLCVQFPQVREWFDFMEENAARRGSESRAPLLFPAPTCLTEAQRQVLEERLYEMDVASESVFAASLGLHSLLQHLDLAPDAMLGHSTGENTVLTAAGVNRVQHRNQTADAVRDFHRIYRELDAAGKIAEGTLLTIGGLNAATRKSLLDDLGEMLLAMDNCPNQVVLFGPPAAAERLRERLSAEGAICQILPFGRAYHTALFKPLADAFRDYFKKLDLGPGRTALYSASTGAPFPEDADGIRELAARQWENPVRFTQTVERLYADGYRVFLEVGPSGNLTSFVGDILRSHDDVLAVSCNSRRKADLPHLHQTLAQLHAIGIGFDPSQLFVNREIAALDLATPKAPVKPVPQLKLVNPTWKLPEQFKKPLPTQTVTVMAPTPAPGPAASAAPPLPAVPGLPAAAGSTQDPRLSALQAHFSLMQDFLDSQARVLGLLGSSAPQTAAVAAPAGVATSVPQGFDPAYPMLGVITEQAPGKQTSERIFDIGHDRFLRDHTLGNAPSGSDPSLCGLPVIPFTFSMELIAQAAARLINRTDRVVIAIENSRGSRWLSLDKGTVHLRVIAEQRGEDQAHCRVFLLGESNTPGGVLVFEGTVLLAAGYPPAPPAQPLPSTGLQPPVLHQPGQLYSQGMFHGPRLQGCTRLAGFNAAGMIADMVSIATRDYFASTATPRFQFDAALLDAAGQVAGFWLRERSVGLPNCFPFRVQRLSLYAPPPAAGLRFVCHGAIQMQGDTQLSARWDVVDAQQRLIMRAEGWDDRVFSAPERFFAFRLDPVRARLSTPALAERLPTELCLRRLEPLPEGTLDEGGTIWKRMFAHMVLSRAERELFYALPAQGPRREEWLMGRLAAKDAVRDWYAQRGHADLAPADVEILSDAQGRPYVRCALAAPLAAPAVSLAHSQRWAGAVAADASVSLGLDYQRLGGVRSEDLLAGGFSAAEQALALAQQSDAATRERNLVALWCAKEAAAKAAGSGLQGRPLDWQVVAAALDTRNGAPPVARVRHAQQDYDVALHFEHGAILALCVTAAAQSQPLGASH
ncbi:Acyl transferase domain-containing protein [Solimonas aquatica]|uniref:Acyl transferase domain-containing protein n=1 Tax=Solimonas aquatica TaxID=489703 RepID=A0A1H9K9Q9_9GAMM|nr:type I polyketide synthase [Solimonas aquatica]SEQ95788.1 Acyl transferase domain-containing protein [Solimonas aquatica]